MTPGEMLKTNNMLPQLIPGTCAREPAGSVRSVCKTVLRGNPTAAVCHHSELPGIPAGIPRRSGQVPPDLLNLHRAAAE